MPYYVLAPDGSKFGPADAIDLKEMASSHLIGPGTLLEDVTNRRRLRAREVPGVFEETQDDGLAAHPGSIDECPLAPLPARISQPEDDEKNSLGWAFALCFIGAVVFLLAPIFCTFGLIQANKAIAKGYPSGRMAKLLNLVFLIFGSILWLGLILSTTNVLR